MTGISREAVVGDVAPVLLTGFGAIFALSFLQSKIHPAFAGYMSIVFTTFFFFGVVLGGHHRELSARAVASLDGGENEAEATEARPPSLPVTGQGTPRFPPPPMPPPISVPLDRPLSQ